MIFVRHLDPTLPGFVKRRPFYVCVYIKFSFKIAISVRCDNILQQFWRRISRSEVSRGTPCDNRGYAADDENLTPL